MFVPIAGRIIADLISKEEILPKGRAVEMGNQTYSIDGGTMKWIKEKLKEEERLTQKYAINFDKLDYLARQKPAGKPKEEGVPHIKEFFEALGFKDYQSIDINDDFGSLVMDLNQDIRTLHNFKEEFDLVTNIGVSEHLIGQANFMQNAHNLARKGGVMLHILPFLGYINHGFFNYQPRFFQDLASANDYDVLGLYLAERDRIIIDLNQPSELLVYFYQYLHLLLTNERYSAFVVAILRKKNDTAFKLPLQGKYLKDLSSGSSSVKQYHNQKEYVAATKGFFSSPQKISLRVRIKTKLLKIVNALLKMIIKYA